MSRNRFKSKYFQAMKNFWDQGINIFFPIIVVLKNSGFKTILNVCLFAFYGISIFVGYLMLNPFLYK